MKPVADRWRNRRAMAWLALVASLAYPLLVLAAPDCATLSALAGPFFLFTAAVVGAYVGFATLDDRWHAGHSARYDPQREAPYDA